MFFLPLRFSYILVECYGTYGLAVMVGVDGIRKYRKRFNHRIIIVVVERILKLIPHIIKY